MNGITELVFILDRSGSMQGLESDTIGGFNAMLEKQRKSGGTVLLSTILFNQESFVLHDRRDIREVPALTEKEYDVSGCTALYDAVGGAIRHIRNIHRYIRPEDVPDHTLFVITTDGLENASTRFTLKDVRRLIEERKEKGWEFLFLGANIDAVEAARDLGASEARAFFDITRPLIAPGVVSGALLAFAMSMDDVIISFFVTGATTTTLPLKVYSSVKTGVSPQVNALCTLTLFVVAVLVALSKSITRRNHT